MAFDVRGALKAGYSPAEIADYLGSQEGFDVTAARKAGYKDDEITAHLLAVAPAPAAAPGMDAMVIFGMSCSQRDTSMLWRSACAACSGERP